jgi:catechol-2,3-dioxygenase
MSTAVRALGEVALRVNDLDNSQAFYADVIGLELMRRFEHAAFFRIAEGYAGHTAILALFDRETPSSRRIPRSTMWRSPSRTLSTRPRSGGWRGLDSA